MPSASRSGRWIQYSANCKRRSCQKWFTEGGTEGGRETSGDVNLLDQGCEGLVPRHALSVPYSV